MTATALPPITEAAFQKQVMDLAKLLGWDLRYHPFLSKWSERGWPDLALARRRDGRFLLAELKAEKGKLSDRQAEVIDLLVACGVPVYVWRPSQLEQIAEVLR
ncbi:MAG: VRR-NUC domain-containing protein [Candidatus Limnocylindrales bacterium]